MLIDEAIQASDQIKGWLTQAEQSLLYDVARRVPAGGVIVELGSWMGRSTIMLGAGSLAGHRPRIYAVDLFATGADDSNSQYDSYINGQPQDYLPVFEENVRRAGVDSVVEPIRGLTTESARRWSGSQINFLFIDANHSYEAVQDDFFSWIRYCTPGSYCAFHDFSNHQEPGVHRFVDPLLATRVLTEVRFADSIVCGKLAITDPDQIRRRLNSQALWQPFESVRPMSYRSSKHTYCKNNGWVAFAANDRRSAIYEGIQCITLKPWKIESWRLLACAILKTNRRS
ncbi:hypothetical protein BH23PLA1_BH23PLA1_21070 [soil metagenome]